MECCVRTSKCRMYIERSISSCSNGGMFCNLCSILSTFVSNGSSFPILLLLLLLVSLLSSMSNSNSDFSEDAEDFDVGVDVDVEYFFLIPSTLLEKRFDIPLNGNLGIDMDMDKVVVRVLVVTVGIVRILVLLVRIVEKEDAKSIIMMNESKIMQIVT
jgi:hypothetical protein